MSPTQQGASWPDPARPRKTGPGIPAGGAAVPPSDEQLESLEMRLLLEAVADRYGYDFRDYNEQFIRSRVRGLLAVEQLPTLTALMDKILRDSRVMDRLITAVASDPVPFFDNPAAYAALRRHVIPHLREAFFVRAWQVGCATGERAYSLAILFKEEGLEDHSRIYVTDLNGAALRKARQGIYPVDSVRNRFSQYREAGGSGSLEDHYTVSFDSALIDPSLRRNLVFAQHNLVTDGSFNEFHLIVCIGILARFNARLQARVLALLHDSLSQGGYLLLSPGETPQTAGRARDYTPINAAQGLFQKLS